MGRFLPSVLRTSATIVIYRPQRVRSAAVPLVTNVVIRYARRMAQLLVPNISNIKKNGGCSSVVERYIVIVDAESSILSNRPIQY